MHSRNVNYAVGTVLKGGEVSVMCGRLNGGERDDNSALLWLVFFRPGVNGENAGFC